MRLLIAIVIFTATAVPSLAGDLNRYVVVDGTGLLFGEGFSHRSSAEVKATEIGGSVLPDPPPLPGGIIRARWSGSAWVEGTPLADLKTIRGRALAASLIAYQDARYPAGLLAAINRARSRGTAVERVAAFDAWIDAVTVYYTDRLAAIATAADADAAHAVTWDFTTFDASDPLVTLAEVMR